MKNQVYLKGQYSIPTNYKEYIEINPNDHFAKPVLKGTSVSVHEVLSWLSLKMSSAKVIEAYPNLTIGSIRACLSYAADKGERIQSES
jgi:uncharacterized protein (DUF433 family)